uniref:Uncharacterized protein n=1 Tax=Ciona savignyi TaxID=51511 RepID=H2YNE0_CIOSA
MDSNQSEVVVQKSLLVSPLRKTKSLGSEVTSAPKAKAEKQDEFCLRKIRFSGKEKTPGVKSFANTRFSSRS